MSAQNVSKHAAMGYMDGTTSTFVLNRGFRSVTRTAGQPIGCYDLKADVNAGGNWAPSECMVVMSSQATADNPSPLAVPPLLIDYRWLQDVDLTWYLQIRLINPDGGILANGNFSVKIERIN